MPKLEKQTELYKVKEERLNKLHKLKTAFEIDPYLLNLEETETGLSKKLWKEFKVNRKLSLELKNKFQDIEIQKPTKEQFWVAGRIQSLRNSGMFIDLYDQEGKIQVIAERSELSKELQKEDLHILDLLDKGDILAAKGVVYKTPRGEISLRARELIILSKCTEVPPEIIEKKRKRFGLTETEVRYRKRHLDLMANPKSKEIFKIRSLAILAIREFLIKRGFLEFETPVLQTQAGGASARPFTTHHNTLGLDLFLRIATELHLKRLLVGGFEKVFELGRIFRNEGISTKHNPEFTSVEIYQAYSDQEDMLELTQNLILFLLDKLGLGNKLIYQEKELNFATDWPKYSMEEIVKKTTGEDFSVEQDLEELKKKLLKLKLSPDKFVGLDSTGKILNFVFEELVEKTLIQPTFIFDYPWEVSPLAGLSPNAQIKKTKTYLEKQTSKSKYAERFELFIAGKEIANAFSELNDPIYQLKAFQTQQNEKEKGNQEAHSIDYDFVNTLEFAMPPSGGLGIGIDRLIMLLTNAPSIREVILFPTMRPLNKSS